MLRSGSEPAIPMFELTKALRDLARHLNDKLQELFNIILKLSSRKYDFRLLL
jgi:hypothetical protein